MFKSLRKGAIAALVLGTGLASVTPAQADGVDAHVLIDIQGHWAQQSIQQWVDKGFVKGYQDHTFKPNAGITRAEFMTLANRAIGAEAKSELQFSDVLPAQWFYEEVAKAHAAGYIAGYEDGTMKPNKQVTRQEVAVMIAKMASLNAETSVLHFMDAGTVPSWSKAAIAGVVAQGFMNGYPDQTFRPAKAITRAEAIATLHKLLPETPAQPEAATPVNPEQVPAPVTPVPGGGGAAPAPAPVVAVQPTAANLSLTGAAFSGEGTDLSISISKTTVIDSLSAELNAPVKVEVLAIRNQAGSNFRSLLPTTTANVDSGQQTINLYDILGLSQLGVNQVTGGQLSNFLNDKETGNVTISIKLTNTNDSAKTTTYNLTLQIN